VLTGYRHGTGTNEGVAVAVGDGVTVSVTVAVGGRMVTVIADGVGVGVSVGPGVLVGVRTMVADRVGVADGVGDGTSWALTGAVAAMSSKNAAQESRTANPNRAGALGAESRSLLGMYDKCHFTSPASRNYHR